MSECEASEFAGTAGEGCSAELQKRIGPILRDSGEYCGPNITSRRIKVAQLQSKRLRRIICDSHCDRADIGWIAQDRNLSCLWQHFLQPLQPLCKQHINEVRQSCHLTTGAIEIRKTPQALTPGPWGNLRPFLLGHWRSKCHSMRTLILAALVLLLSTNTGSLKL